jgi:hypothetical protein
VLVLANPRQVDAVRDVAREPPVLHRHIEDEAEHAVDLSVRGKNYTFWKR